MVLLGQTISAEPAAISRSVTTIENTQIMNNKPVLLVSACLMAQPVRYDGSSKPISTIHKIALEQRYTLIAACPECLGGLSTPRPAAEIYEGNAIDVLNKKALVLTKNNQDVSTEFLRGAAKTLQLVQEQNCQYALLKARSPSCGNQQIYNGHFKQQLIPGRGVTAQLLYEHHISIWNEEEVEQLINLP
ncbi:DUF523 domain-containing protein [Neisseriaceae bacterium TC5R-5]|nr:DUF523 domain-containing protein [Neisseriaceae bacterium TC5R-5]